MNQQEDQKVLGAHEYLFDVQLDASITVKAPSEEVARTALRAELQCASANLGEILGQTIVCEVSLNDEPVLAMIDCQDAPAPIRAVFPSDLKLSGDEGSWVSVKVKNLIGAALDWAVAKAEGLPVIHDPMGFKTGSESGYWVWSNEPSGLQTKVGRGYSPSTIWAQGGLIVDRERPHMAPVTYNGEPSWQSWVCGQSSASGSFGSTFLIAAMRCHVTSRFGDEIEVPAAVLQ